MAQEFEALGDREQAAMTIDLGGLPRAGTKKDTVRGQTLTSPQLTFGVRVIILAV